MEEIKDWFTLDNIRNLAGAAFALRLMVEWTKELFDSAWQWVFKGRPKTLLYAMVWAAFIVYGIGIGDDWRANLFNVVLLTVAAGVLQKPKAPEAPQG